MFSDHFAFVLNGSRGGKTHSISGFATFPWSHPSGYDWALLAVAPMSDEVSLWANNLFEHLETVVCVHDKTMYKVVVTVRDNEKKIKAFTRCARKMFIRCFSHRYNLALEDVNSDHSDVVCKVWNFMRKLSFQIPSALFRWNIGLQAKSDVETRWSSTYYM